MTYASLEASVADGRPVFLYRFSQGAETWHLTARATDWVSADWLSTDGLSPDGTAGTLRWRAAAIAHGEVVQSADIERARLAVSLPRSDGFARRFLRPHHRRHRPDAPGPHAAFRSIGYDGTTEAGPPETEQGAHVLGRNAAASASAGPAGWRTGPAVGVDNMTPAQQASLGVPRPLPRCRRRRAPRSRTGPLSRLRCHPLVGRGRAAGGHCCCRPGHGGGHRPCPARRPPRAPLAQRPHRPSETRMTLWTDEMTGLIVSTAIGLLLPYLIYGPRAVSQVPPRCRRPRHPRQRHAQRRRQADPRRSPSDPAEGDELCPARRTRCRGLLAVRRGEPGPRRARGDDHDRAGSQGGGAATWGWLA